MARQRNHLRRAGFQRFMHLIIVIAVGMRIETHHAIRVPTAVPHKAAEKQIEPSGL